MVGVEIYKKYDCSTCQIDKQKSMNCLGTKEKNNRISLCKDIRILYVRRCPRALIEEHTEAIDYWNEYLTWKCLKALPEAGGTDDQDARFIEAIKFISNLINQIELDDDYVKWQTKKSKEKHEKETEKEEKKINSFADISRNRNK